jgi:hypothetical protein
VLPRSSASTRSHQAIADAAKPMPYAGARFRFIRNGVVLQATDSDSRRRFSAERRTSTGDYPGAGVYRLCAANHATYTLVNLHILVNNEFI